MLQHFGLFDVEAFEDVDAHLVGLVLKLILGQVEDGEGSAE